MPRLIDADKLLKTIMSLESWNVPDFVYESINNAPTVDAVEVVRCKDCKWFRVYKTAVWCNNERGLVEPRYDSFCSWGERREDADK